MAVWVKLSKLPMEWINSDLLWNVWGMLGTTYKVDPITETQARGRFARICVEIDITKPLKGMLNIEERVIKVEYENLGLICYKCGRVGHSKEVFYGRNMRSNNGPKFARKRSGNMDSLGKMDNDNRVESGPHTHEVKTSRQSTETRKEDVKNIIDRSSKDGLSSAKDTKVGVKKVGGKQLNSPASKYLLSNLGDNSSFNKSIKENVRKGNVKSNKKGKQQVTHTQTGSQINDMEEDLQDSKVLNIFHREASQIMVPGYQSLSSGEINDNIVVEKDVDPKLDSSLQQIDISNASSFDEVASKLKKAMEGAGKKGFAKAVIDLQNLYKFEASGFSGGIWLLWNDNKVKLQVVASSGHTITIVVVKGSDYWVLTIVYVNPSVVIRRHLWKYLSAIRDCFKGPWVVMGDFNEITCSMEKRGGRGYFSKTGFVDWISENKLVDLGFISQKFTWITRRGISEDIWE
ncbi:hypothetical protein Dsin_008270 [Dipteronia sinensis]|uniref:Zinc knuckle CX2CX4HX4C domain-containing protein n=1 Tax=Dipteronia sinensis TaxID=43782 RepID=A0AAE0ECB7_9ROSI|nr:hypothetical protein Dsin_008270 [Dipteronia sinensis]